MANTPLKTWVVATPPKFIATMMGLMMGQRKIIYVVLSLLIISFALIGATIYHFRVEKPRIASINSAMTGYQKVVDAEWNNSDCAIVNCPQSSKGIPGVPIDRELLTAAERFNLEIRDSMATVLPSPRPGVT